MWFFYYVWVEANDPEEAELNAISELRKHEDLKSGLLNKPKDSPLIYLEKIRELEPDYELQENDGRTFFPELDEKGQHEAKKLELEALWS